MPLTYYAANKVLDALHGKAALPAQTLYLGLLTGTPTVGGGGTFVEPSGNGYNRIAVPATAFNAAANGTITNNVELAFPTATGPWGTVTNIGAFDSQTGGNGLFFAGIPAQVVGANITPKIAVGAATTTVT